MDYSSDTNLNDSTPTSRIQSRMSKVQKFMLQRLIDNHPNIQKVSISHALAQRLWSKIASELHNVPGARKTWMQWRRTWKDTEKNAKTSQTPTLIDYDYELSITEDSLNEGVSIGNVLKDAVDENSGSGDIDDEIHGQRRRVSKVQKKLLYNLVKSNEKLQKGNGSCVERRREWKKIAIKLNSTDGPKKTWIQWKKCWLDIKKYYNRLDVIEKVFESQDDDSEIAASVGTKTSSPTDFSDKTPSAIQVNSLVKEIVKQREVTNQSIWVSLTNTLNAIGPSVKTSNEWQNVWKDYKRNLLKVVAKNGTNNLNSLQQSTYEYIKRERSKNTCDTSVSPILAEHQLQRLKRTAEEECNAVGSLVAVKLRSMQKEQKLIAEKLISEILFQGQMEMFQYSNKAVNIPGYL